MAMIGGDDQLTGLLLQFLENQKERKRQQAAALLNTLQPGQALASLTPGNPNKAVQAYKRITGVKATPDTVIVPQTVENLERQEDVQTFGTLTPQQRRTQAHNRLLNRTTGQTGVRSLPQYEAQTAAGEAVARGQRDVAEAGERAIANAPQERLGAAGEKLILGETTTETKAGEVKAGTDIQYTEYAANFLRDPENSAWGNTLKQMGLDPKGVTEGFATGQAGLLNNFFSFKIAEMNNIADAKDKVEEARIEVAKDVAKRTGGAIPVRTYLALENAVEGGQDLFEVGVPPETVQLYLKQKELSMGAALRTSIATENPSMKLVEQTYKNLKDFENLDLLNAANTLATGIAAEVITEQELGPRPGPEMPEQRAEWDRRARQNRATMQMVGKRVDSFAGLDWLNPDEPFVQPDFPWATPQHELPPAAGTEGATRQPGDTSRGPLFADPAAAGAVRGALNLGSDTTFRRRGAGQSNVPARPTPLRPGVPYNPPGRSRAGGAVDSTTASGAPALNPAWLKTATPEQVYAIVKDLPEAQLEQVLTQVQKVRGLDFELDVSGQFPAE